MYDQDGNPVDQRGTCRDRYFVTDHDGIERETDAEGYLSMERSCGFRPKPGCGPFATAGFSRDGRSGRIAPWFDGPADVYDILTGAVEHFADCRLAVDHAVAENAGESRTRYVVQRAKVDA